MEDVVNAVFSRMSNVKKPQRKFMLTLFAVLMVFQGKATFLNMERYSCASEKRYRRWSRRDFDFAQFNTELIIQAFPGSHECIAAIDASFISKSGHNTEGLGWYYNGSANESQRGLEISMISITNLKSNTAYALDAQQTIDEEGRSRVELYADHAIKLAPKLLDLGIKYLATDAYYSKVKFVSPVTLTGLHIVGKLRVDANLQWLYEGVYKGSGRPKKYDGKVDFDTDLYRFDHAGALNDTTEVYTKIVHANFLNRKIRVVMLKSIKGNKEGHALLYSTDTELDAMALISYYKSRFQIEFLFRDAKQHTGLTHCQSTRKEAINFHINASLTALNLLKIKDKKVKQTNEKTVISIASWKRRKFNQPLMDRLFDELELDLRCRKVAGVYERYSAYGAIDV